MFSVSNRVWELQIDPDEAIPKTRIWADFRLFLVMFDRCRPVWSKTSKIDSKSAPLSLRGVARRVWPCGGGGSVAGGQVTILLV